MNKFQYLAKKLPDINWLEFKQSLAGETRTLAVDVAKKQHCVIGRCSAKTASVIRLPT